MRDFNGDGFDDLALGAASNSDAATAGGAAYIYFGSDPLDSASRSTADATLLGDRDKGQLGASITRAGDLNGDGLADLLIGAPGAPEGRAYVYFGNPGEVFDVTPDGILGEGASITSFGSAVAGAGDVNGDGFDDVIVGALHDSTGGHLAGSARIYFGGPGPAFDATPDVTLVGEPSEFFGWAVAGVSDINDDGFEDVVVSSPFFGSGRVRLFLGGPRFDTLPDATLTGELPGDQFGYAIAGAGDVNGDRIADLVIGAPAYSAPPREPTRPLAESGRAYFYFGGKGSRFDTTADAVISGHRHKERLGRAVAIIGDLNGDRFADTVVTAGGFEEEDSILGEARVILGSEQFAADIFATIVGKTASFGKTVTSAGDLNDDGLADLIISAPSAKEVFGADVYFGVKGRSFDPYVDLTLRSPKGEAIVVR